MNICISAHSCTFWYLLVRTAYKLVHNFRYVQLVQAGRQEASQPAAAHGPFKGLFICNFPKIEQLVCVCEWRLLQCIALFTIIKSLLPSKSNSLSIFQSFEFIIFHWPPGPPGCKCRRRHPHGATIAAPATLAPMRRGGGSSQPRRSWKKSRARTWSDIWKKKVILHVIWRVTLGTPFTIATTIKRMRCSRLIKSGMSELR